MNEYLTFLSKISNHFNSGNADPAAAIEITDDFSVSDMTPEQWSSMTRDERWDFLQAFIIYQSKAIGLTNVPNARRMFVSDPYVSRYICATNTLEINISGCVDLYESLDFIAHELNYAYQDQAVKTNDTSRYTKAELMLLKIQKQFYDPGLDPNNPFHNTLTCRDYLMPDGSLCSLSELGGLSNFDSQMMELDSTIAGANCILANILPSKNNRFFAAYLQRKTLYFGRLCNLLINHPDMCDKGENWQLQRAEADAQGRFSSEDLQLAQSAIGPNNTVRLRAIRMTAAVRSAFFAYIEPFAASNHNRCSELLLTEQSRTANAEELEEIRISNIALGNNILFIENDTLRRVQEIKAALCADELPAQILPTTAEQQRQLKDLEQDILWCKKELELMDLESKVISGTISTSEYHAQLIQLGSLDETEGGSTPLYSVYAPYVTFCLKRATEVHLACVASGSSSTTVSSPIAARGIESNDKKAKRIQKIKRRLTELVPSFEARIANIKKTRDSYAAGSGLSYDSIGTDSYLQSTMTELRNTEIILKDIEEHIELLDADLDALDPKAAEKKKAAPTAPKPHYYGRKPLVRPDLAKEKDAKDEKADDVKEVKEATETGVKEDASSDFVPPYMRKRNTIGDTPADVKTTATKPVAPATDDDEDDIPVRPARPVASENAGSSDDDFVPPYMRGRKAATKPATPVSDDDDEDDIPVRTARPAASESSGSGDDDFVPPYMRGRKAATKPATPVSEDEDEDDVPIRPARPVASENAGSGDDDFVPPYMRGRKAATKPATPVSEDEDEDDVPVRPTRPVASDNASSGDDDFVPPYMRGRKAATKPAAPVSEDEDEDDVPVRPTRPVASESSGDDDFVPPYMRGRKAATKPATPVSEDEDEDDVPVRTARPVASESSSSGDDDFVPPYMRGRKSATKPATPVSEDENEDDIPVRPARPVASENAASGDDDFVPPYMRGRKAATKPATPVSEDEDEDDVPVRPARPSAPAESTSGDDDFVPPYMRGRKAASRPAPSFDDEEEEAPKPASRPAPRPVDEDDEDDVPVRPARPSAPAESTSGDDDFVPPYMRGRKAASRPVPSFDDEEEEAPKPASRPAPRPVDEDDEDDVPVRPAEPTASETSSDSEDEYVPPYMRRRR